MTETNINQRPKGEIVIYKAPEGPEVQVKWEGETFWLSLQQIADFFERDKSVISRHLSAIFKEGELERRATVAKNATVQFEGDRVVKREVEYYNLDAIISVGYRVSSKKATLFRKWATQKLKELMLKGYSLNEKVLKDRHDLQVKELQQTVKLFQNVLEAQRADGYEKDLLNIITDYANTWAVLSKFDEGKLAIENTSTKKASLLDYQEIKKTILKFKQRLALRKEASGLFGQEVGEKFKALLGAIGQTFSNKELYPSIEEKAAHLFYFAIKDHPFVDGNKRIASLIFLLFLIENHYLYNRRGERKINDSATAALALLIAESKPEQKDVMVKLVVNLINKK